ncbi:hypothetical protein RclHR1_02800003 [Rhizophagus clarus]|uniref:Ubiquitin-related domain-containing protein n=1 Tax=Rhizophagus clarus TaxID=94130 RepID=A0A2Z6R2V6_9GLOM|nr:hypothetical protein RclHR1_02800003 [Rhizophagus clarus]GES74443.1 ubiquitin-related domain-containing protein [Rhizophagus clarus]
MSQLPLVASAISTIIDSPVKTYDECVNNGLTINPSQILDVDTIHKRSLTRIEFEDNDPPEDVEFKCNDPPKEIGYIEKSEIQIFIKPLVGDTRSMFVDPSITVLKFKIAICAKLEFNIEAMRLMFDGKQLNDDKTLASYKIQKGSTIQVLSRVVGGFDFYVITKDLLDPSYDFDFTNLYDFGVPFVRGMELYKRPYGWKRIALNVRKYEHDKTWLGRVGNNPHEWPVSYHGTRKECADSIAKEGYLISKVKRSLFGKGIYSSPDINIAEGFAKQFDHNNVRYKVVFQNRVNPVGLQKYINDMYWVTLRDEDIRPNGLCIKRASGRINMIIV